MAGGPWNLFWIILMVPGDVSKGPRGIPAKKNFKLRGHLIFAQYVAETFEICFSHDMFALWSSVVFPLSKKVTKSYSMVIYNNAKTGVSIL